MVRCVASTWLQLQSLLLVTACTASPREADWDIALGEGVAERMVALEATITASACDGTVVYREQVTVAGAPSPPPLGLGEHCFQARARDDDCVWFAAGETLAELPLTTSNRVLTTVVAGPETAACHGHCEDGRCEGEDADAGFDAGLVTATDGGPPPVDGGPSPPVDGGPPPPVDSGGVDAGVAMPGTTSYSASVAACVSPATLDPAMCETDTGPNQMNVDAQDSDTLQPFHSFVRFDPDSALAGRTIRRVQLELTVSDDPKANGPNSGEVWRVSAFTLAGLSTAVPSQTGGSPAAGDRGAVSQNDVIRWTLPTSVFTPGSPVYLGIFPRSTDGVNYWNRGGRSPPALVVDYD